MKVPTDADHTQTNQPKTAAEVRKDTVSHKAALLAGRVFASPWIAYFSILAFQLWRLGFIWKYKDLTYGVDGFGCPPDRAEPREDRWNGLAQDCK